MAGTPALVSQRDKRTDLAGLQLQRVTDEAAGCDPEATFKHKSDLEMSDILLNYPHVGYGIELQQRNVISRGGVKYKSGSRRDLRIIL